MPLQLRVTLGPDKGRTFPLVPGEIMQIGRSQTTTTKLIDPTVSRIHCEILWEHGFPILENCSEFGTKVNSVVRVKYELQAGDIIQVGNTDLRLQDTDVDKDATSTERPIHMD